MNPFRQLSEMLKGLGTSVERIPEAYEQRGLTNRAKEQTRQICVDAIALCFDTSTAPDGTPWRPLKYREGRPLLLTHRLKSEAQYAAKEMQITPRGLIIEQSQPFYYKFHQLGTRTIPARPWLGLSDVAQKDIEKTIGKDLENFAVQWITENIVGGNIINRR